MAEQLPRGLLADPAVQRAMLLPVARRTYTDPGDDITEEQALELAMPGLLYDPMLGMAQTGAMLMGDMPADPNVMTQTMLDAPLIGGLLGAATGAVPKGAVLGANVFHGGPHRFAPEPDFPHGRPRLDKIGTGEGAQAYGYGFYSADARGVADQYRQNLAYDPTEMKISGKQVNEVYNEINNRAARLSPKASEKEYEKMEILERIMMHDPLDEIADYSKNLSKETADWFANEVRPNYQTFGALYKLDIPDADVAKYLDYDKPLSEQPKSIQAALSELLEGNATKRLAEAEKALRGLNEGDAGWSAASSEYRRARQNVQNMVGPGHPTADVAGLMKTLAAEYGSPQAASEALRKAGIPGLKYFDADSRGVPKADRTRNYVTWDQDVLDRSKMLERDGVTLGANKAPTAALPGLLDDTASRMQRARDMGFNDEVLFHGTSDDVRYFDLDHPNRKDSGWLGTGVYLTDDPNLASFYSSATAGPVGPNVLPMKVKLKNPYNATLKDKERLKMISFTKGKEAARAAADEWTAELQKKGHDGVVLQYDPKDVGAANASKEVVVFDTRNVRSTSAKFDPAKADSADLLAANPATAALPGLLQDRRRTPRNQNSFPMRSLLGQRVYTATMPDGSI